MPNPLKEMGLTDEAAPSEVKKRWKEIAVSLHPDKGGNVEDFKKANEIYQEALRFASLPRICTNCKGTGKQHSATGFNTIYRPCSACKGEGKIVLD